jgi:hypothetical protein
MKNDSRHEQAVTRNQETAKASRSDLPDKVIRLDSVHSHQSDSEDDEEMHGKAERWHTFKTP